ncbi:response regulator transcription factor [candidate division KSB1 bacterium]|nr:response regulator transcription factor [candidate division KSB1 bacterium]
MSTIINVFVADDHQIFRQGLIKLLEAENSIKILGESGDGLEAYRMIQELQPEVAILDICMPGMDGLEIVSNLRKELLPIEFIILTMYTEEEYFNTALNYGVKGYLLKDNAISDLVAGIKCVAQGKYYISPLISDYLVNREEKMKEVQSAKPGLANLSRREKSILKLIAENKTSKEIARLLFISPRTVENHRHHICEKLNLKGPHKLMQFSLENKAYI